MYVLEVRTVQASAFRILIEALKEILTDANLEFDETGMKIMAMDSSHTVLVHLKLTASNFELYKCKNKISNEEVAKLTLKCLKASVPSEVPGIAFLSCLLYTSPSPRDLSTSRMPSSA